MSGTRFARTGRCRFLVCLGILILMVGIVAIFHSSQVQLDETREQRLHCEQQQEALNERLTTLVEQKYRLERNQERERIEQLETKRNLEQKIKELEEKYQKEQIEQQMHYDKLKQSHVILQSDHKHLKEETQKANKQQLENINSLEKKLQSVRSELQKEKSNKSGELIEWREKYNIAENENKRLRDLLSTDSQKLHVRIEELEKTVKEYQSHCEYKVMENSRKPVAPKPDMSNPSTSEKSFKHQVSVSPGVYHISVNISRNNKNTKTLNGSGVTSSNEPSNAHVGVKDNIMLLKTTKTSALTLQNPFDTNNDIIPLTAKHFNGSLILNSVENFQIVPKPIKRIADDEQQQQEKPNRQNSREIDKNQVAPLSAPKNNGQLGSTATSKSEQQMKAASAINATIASVRTARGSSTRSSNSPPLALPPNQRKLPENVAPIPENLEDLLQKANSENPKSNDDQLQLKDNKNNDLNKNKVLKSSITNSNRNNKNYDSGAHEKDVVAGGESNNVQHEDDMNNFFDTDQDANEHNKNDNHKDINEDKEDDVGNDDDDGGLGLGADNDVGGGSILGGAAAGDIAVKHNQQHQLLDDSLRNEVADDQGKEFGEVLDRLDEGAMEEEDDDDYSNPSAFRQAGGQAIRN